MTNYSLQQPSPLMDVPSYASDGTEGSHSIALRIDHPVMPYVRMTQRSKYASKRARAYLDNQEALKWLLAKDWIKGGQEILPIFPKGVKLRLSVKIARAPETKWIIPETTKPYQRTTHPARTSDLSNLLKALEDAANGTLWADDRQIWKYGPCEKLEDETDWFWLKVEEIE